MASEYSLYGRAGAALSKPAGPEGRFEPNYKFCVFKEMDNSWLTKRY